MSASLEQEPHHMRVSSAETYANGRDENPPTPCQALVGPEQKVFFLSFLLLLFLMPESSSFKRHVEIVGLPIRATGHAKRHLSTSDPIRLARLPFRQAMYSLKTLGPHPQRSRQNTERQPMLAPRQGLLEARQTFGIKKRYAIRETNASTGKWLLFCHIPRLFTDRARRYGLY